MVTACGKGSVRGGEIWCCPIPPLLCASGLETKREVQPQSTAPRHAQAVAQNVRSRLGTRRHSGRLSAALVGFGAERLHRSHREGEKRGGEGTGWSPCGLTNGELLHLYVDAGLDTHTAQPRCTPVSFQPVNPWLLYTYTQLRDLFSAQKR